MSGPHDVSVARTVLVGVTGGVAIYKSVELVRGLNSVGLTISNDPDIACLVIHPMPDDAA